MLNHITTFFDKLEDRIRIALSHYPITYSIIGGIGIVLFWKGVWETAGIFPVLFGPLSALVGIIVLLLTGLMVSFFVGDSIILSGFNREKKLVEKTETEVRADRDINQRILEKLGAVEEELKDLGEKVDRVGQS
jgi:hypothetical protein